jgi:2-polyprenyl-3-methyl-5-hydroxy-6-metoxy-1,4-benzoquinol methylase
LNRLAQNATYFYSWLRNRKARRYFGNDVLDIGCGRGMTIGFLPASTSYVGIDLSLLAIERLRKLYPAYDFYQHDVDSGLPTNLGDFDTVIMLAIIEHLTRPQYALEQCREHLRPGGNIVITTPTPHGERLHGFLQRLSLANPGTEQSHFHIYTPRELADLVSKSGFIVITIKRFEFGSNQLLVAKKPLAPAQLPGKERLMAGPHGQKPELPDASGGQ